MLRLFFIVTLVCAGLTSCGDGLEERSETTEIGYRRDYSVDPATGYLQGDLREYNTEGQLIMEEHYVDDTLQGNRRLYAPNGELIVEETYVDGEFEGPYRGFAAEGGKTIEGQYVDGAMAGEWTFYYPNGQAKERVTFADNNENGPFREWYEDGTLKALGSYRDGDKEDGILHLYAADGELERVMNCELAICRTIWTPDSLGAAPAPPPVE